MATFEGTNQEFKRYIGPHLRNVVNLFTKKHKAATGACEHCGSSKNLESAHVRGKDRTDIIDLLLGTYKTGDVVRVDIRKFEEAFKSEHQPFEKAILILCHDCHRKYDSVAVRRRTPAPLTPRASTPDILPITLDPPRADAFKDRLLHRKAAELTVFYRDGHKESRSWDASRFTSTSNVFRNLRSRPEFRQGKWQSLGIVKINVRVLEDA